MEEWELSKENIQPLKHGRKMSTLNNVLQCRDEETQKHIAEERNAFETEIRTYAGSDPLDPWYRYISWVQQSFPKGGKEGNIHVLIEKCIKLFKDDKKALQDPRFLEVWLKYAGMSTKPLEVYTFMYKRGMCTQQEGLYDAWAWHLETQNNFKSAEVVYLKGLDALTDREAKTGLQARKAQFEARICKRLKGEEIPADEIEEQEERSALGRLRAHGKHGNVGSIRVGAEKLGGPGIIQPVGGPVKQPLKPSNAQGFRIFQDGTTDPKAAHPHSEPPPHHIPGREDYKENNMEAGKWNAVKGPKTINVPLNKISQYAKPTFSVHEDLEDGRSTITPHKLVPGESNVLTARKLDKDDGVLNCPIALFEPPDPTKRPMYCKSKVYQGATEFSFEELRAVRWKREEKVRMEKMEIENRRLELVEMERNLAKQMEEFKRMMMMSQQSAPVVNVIRPSVSDSRTHSISATLESSIVSEGRSAENSYKKTSMDDTNLLINANPSGLRNSSAVTPSSLHRKISNVQPSPTVNTKEALAMMQQFWSENDSLGAAGNNTELPCARPQFQIFSDPTEDVFSRKESVPAGPAPFQIFCDETEDQVPVKSIKKMPTLKGPVFIFEDKEELLDENERRQEDAMRLPRPGMGNYTMFVPDEAEFDKMAKLSSTPFTGRAFVPAEDEYTCDVELFYREKRVDDSLVMPPPVVTEPQPSTPLSPIVETSREHCRSSSSSSGADTTHGTTKGEYNKSHWGNTVSSSQHKTADFTTGLGFSLGTRTPGQGLGSVTSSGYIGDRSSMSSSNRKFEMSSAHEKEYEPPSGKDFAKRLNLGPVAAQDDDQTGMFSDMLAEFKQTIQAVPAVPSGEQLESSMQPSFMDLEGRDRSVFMEPSVLHPNMSAFTSNKSSYAAAYNLKLKVSPDLDRTDVSVPARQGLELTSWGHGVHRSPCTVEPPVLNMTGLTAMNSTVNNDLNVTRETGLDMTGAKGLQSIRAPGLDLTGAHRLSMTGAPGLNMTGAHGLSMTGAPVLNMTGAHGLSMTGATGLNITGAHGLSMSGVPGLNLTGTDNTQDLAAHAQHADEMDTEDQEQIVLVNDLCETKDDITQLNPFSLREQERLLSGLALPMETRHGFVKIPGKLPPFHMNAYVELGEDRFLITGLKGEGGFARVYSATREDDELDCTIAGIDAVLKVQKPANEWEWYICTEVGQRIRTSRFSHLQSAFMSIPRNFSFVDGGVFVSYHQELGNLLDIINILKMSPHKFEEYLSMYYIIEILYIVEALHSVGIIHADIKPDNFLLKGFPRVKRGVKSPEEVFDFSSTSLQLIDFGRAIDLTLLPANISFDQVVKTEGIKCIEMREGRRWREHIDYYGIAATAYCMLFGNYIDVVKKKDVWEVKGSYKRWLKATDLWKEFFAEFLNIKDVNKESLPSLGAWRRRIMERFCKENMQEMIKKVEMEIQFHQTK